MPFEWEADGEGQSLLLIENGDLLLLETGDDIVLE